LLEQFAEEVDLRLRQTNLSVGVAVLWRNR
jgi:hypothetical protein